MDLPGPALAPSAPVVSVKRSIGTPVADDKGRVSKDSDDADHATNIPAKPAFETVAAAPIIVPMTGAVVPTTTPVPVTSAPLPARPSATAPVAVATAERAIALAFAALAAAPEAATTGSTPAPALPGSGRSAGFTLAHHTGEQHPAPKSPAATPKSAAHTGADDKLAAARPAEAASSWLADALQANRPAAATDVANPAAAPASSSPQPALLSFALAELAPPPPPAAMPLWTQAADDQSLRATLTSDTAHVSLDTGAAGELSLHLRIKDGVTDVRVDGMAAQTMDIRQQDLRAALASEGLTLGTFESGQQSAPQHSNVDGRDDAPTSDFVPRGSAANPTGAAPAPKDSQPARTRDGRVHVTA